MDKKLRMELNVRNSLDAAIVEDLVPSNTSIMLQKQKQKLLKPKQIQS